MKKLLGLLCTMLLLLASIEATQADRVLWETNGHCYEAIAYPLGITWDDAKIVAESQTSLGMTGYLATVTSMEENSFILNNLGGPSILNGFFLGGYQPEGSPEPGGNWQWVTGETWSFTNWYLGMPEPNNAYAGDGIFPGTTGTSEEVLQFWAGDGTWNDMSHSAGWGGLIVEYEACDPTPSDPVLWETNGHYYDAIAVPSGITWVDANIDATNASYLEMGGHLATVTSEEENSFILTTFGSTNIVGFLLGGFQLPGSDEPSGGWTWVTGEEWNAWDVSNWKADEPNNAYSGGAIFYHGTSTSEEVLQYSNWGGTWASQFNDVPDMSGWGGYIVEYEPGAPLDTDGDGIPDSEDNCPTIQNPDQADTNQNGIGDACDSTACAGSAVASTYAANPVYDSSGLAKHIAFLLLPIGAVIAIRVWRRKR